MPHTCLDILSLLSDHAVHSHDEIARQLSNSQSAIWYQIQTLKKMGFHINGTPNSGYQLCSPFDFIDIFRINQRLQKYHIAYHIQFIAQTESTNTDLLQQVKQGAAHKTVLICEQQTKGRGRRGKVWHADFGKSLLFSVLYRFEKRIDTIATLTLAVGVSVRRTLATLGIGNLQLKWPNDLVETTHYGKIAGILTEIRGDILTPCAAVIGIGINVYDQQTNAALDYPTASLASLTDHLPDRNTILSHLLIDLDQTLGDYENDQLAPFVDEFNRHCAWMDQTVTVILPSGQHVDGICKGIDEHGALLIQAADTGIIHPFTTGDISLRQSSCTPF